MLRQLYLAFLTALSMCYSLPAVTAANYSTWMAASIVSRRQGIMTGTGGSSELLQAGITQKAFSAYVAQYPNSVFSHQARQYIEQSAVSVATFVTNATYDAISYPLDRLSNGNAMLKLSVSSNANDSQLLGLAAASLRQSIDLNRRNSEGGLWYYVYPQWSYLDGMYSLAPFYTLKSITGINNQTVNTTALDDMLHQFDLLWQHNRNTTSGLLVHGYDDSLTAVWADPVTGASPHVWGRSLGWYTMALVDTLELLTYEYKHRQHLLGMFQQLAEALIHAADSASGAWWQVMDEPGQEGNYIEASGSAMFAYALMKGARLGYLPDAAAATGRKAHGYLTDSFVGRETNGTLGYNGTVSVCSLNSTASYAYYIGQPVTYNSVLGSASYVLASLEVERLDNRQDLELH